MSSSALIHAAARNSRESICIQWPRFGPLHLSRLRAAHRTAADQDIEIVGLETAGRDALYEWRVERGSSPFRRVQIFPDRVYESVASAEIRRKTREVLDQIDPDAVGIVSYSTPDAQAALTWCRKNRRTAILIFSSRGDDVPRTFWRESIKRILISQFDAALVSGSPQHEYLAQLGFPLERVFTTAATVDNTYFRRAVDRLRGTSEKSLLPGLADERPFFLSSNRFIERKNLPFLLRAYADYREQVTDPWRLILLGDGAQRQQLEELVATEQIDGVVFAGFRQIEELPAYYARAGAYVHPARADQWGLVVNEAMAAGLPVAVSAGAGCATDLVDEPHNGFVFPPTDSQRLTEILIELSNDATDRHAMGRRSTEIIAQFAPERFADGLLSAYRSGRTFSDRGLGLPAHAVLRVLGLVQRRVDAFHTVEA